MLSGARVHDHGRAEWPDSRQLSEAPIRRDLGHGYASEEQVEGVVRVTMALVLNVAFASAAGGLGVR
jgi:hypothetical protein